MAIQRVQELYTQKAKIYQSFFINLLKWEKVLSAFFQANDYLHSQMKILDAGCGTGAVTKVLYDLAHQQGLQEISLHAFDLTPAMLDLFGAWVEKEGAKNIALQQANVLDLENQIPPHWKSYDLIVSSAMFEYIPKENLGQALRNLKRLLHENGRLLVFVTRRTWIASWTGALWWRTNLFDPKELEGELQQAGFKTVQLRSCPRAGMLS